MVKEIELHQPEIGVELKPEEPSTWVLFMHKSELGKSPETGGKVKNTPSVFSFEMNPLFGH